MVDDLAGEALGLDRGGDALDEGADRLGPGRDKAEHTRLAPAQILVARAADHQARQLDHQVRLAAGGLKEGLARQGQDFGIAQGDDAGGVGCAGQHGHFADRLARPDDAEEPGGLVIPIVAEDTQTAGAHQIKGVGRGALAEQLFPAGQGEPADMRRLSAREQLLQCRFKSVCARLGHDALCQIPGGAVIRAVVTFVPFAHPGKAA